MAAQFKLQKTKNEQFRFELLADNNETILTSETYMYKQGALNGIESVKTNAPDAKAYKKLTAKNGQVYFNLVAKNGEVIGTSEMYKSEEARDHGIQVVMKVAPTAPVKEV